MTVSQVLEVLDELNRIGPSGVHFGQIAVQMGFLDESTRDRLLAAQKECFAPLGELLVESGALSRDEMVTQLKAYLKAKRSHGTRRNEPAVAADASR